MTIKCRKCGYDWNAWQKNKSNQDVCPVCGNRLISDDVQDQAISEESSALDVRHDCQSQDDRQPEAQHQEEYGYKDAGGGIDKPFSEEKTSEVTNSELLDDKEEKLENNQMTASETEVEDKSRSDFEKTSTRRKKPRKVKRKPQFEPEMQGRRTFCLGIEDIVPKMLTLVMKRVATSQLKSVKGMKEDQLRAELLRKTTISQICDKTRINKMVTRVDLDRNIRVLKGSIVFDILLEQERHALPDSELRDKVLEYEKAIIAEGKECNLLDEKAQDSQRLFAYQTYATVLDAAWRHEDQISIDEGQVSIFL